MSKYFALVGADGVVLQVIVADRDFVDTHPAEEFLVNDAPAGPGCKWEETSMDGSVGKKYAGIGYEFHDDIREFLPKKQFPSWVRDADKAEWKAPVEMPKDGKVYTWDEDTGKWKQK